MEDTGLGVEEIHQNEQVCSPDRGHIVGLINMSLQQLWDLAYKTGFEDGMTFIAKPKSKSK